MFRRKLRAINYYSCDNFNVNDAKHYRQVIAWLEDQKIRQYKIEDRVALRNIDHNQWQNHFENYLSDIGCPFSASQQHIVLDWILTLAVRLEYEDNIDKYSDISAIAAKKASNGHQIQQTNPIDNLDFNSKEFKDGVTELAQLLKVPQHPTDHLLTLKAICIVIRNKICSNEQQSTQKCSTTSANIRTKIEESVLGFNTNDKVLNNCAKVLRLLYIDDLRQLQTKINELIVKVQSITANPVTDTKLGVVGIK